MHFSTRLRHVFFLSDGDSRDTRENALRSFALLSPQGITRIALVTHDWHMQRSKMLFEAAGFQVLPAPMGYIQPPRALGNRFFTIR
jgi:uncharacterized SAM-binding protein YcdF (DUF218 family)